MSSVVIDLAKVKHLHCGLGQFCYHLGQAVLQNPDPAIDPVFLIGDRHRSLFAESDARFVSASLWRRSAVSRVLSIAAPLLSGGDNLWHLTHQDSSFLPAHRSAPVLLTVHDLNFLREKSDAKIARRLSRLQEKITRSTALTTGSEYVADEIRHYMNVGVRPIHVIPHGICIDSTSADSQRPTFLPAGPYLFAIGEITRKKNFHVLIQMMRRLPEYQLVIAGKNETDYAATMKEKIAEAQLQDRVLLPGIVSNSERNWLYQNCEAFLFPSITEGFGLPIVEAMSCGRPVFSSDATSLPEVGGELAFYWRDFSPQAMEQVFREGMQTVKNDPNYEGKLRRHADRFSWSTAVQRYLDVYKQVLESRSRRRAA